MARSNINPKSSIFVAQISDTNVALNFMGRAGDEFEAYGNAYFRAAHALVERNFTIETRHDLDILPIAFLFRHAGELFLKSILRRGALLAQALRKATLKYREGSHSLVELLRAAKQVFELLGWSWDAETEGFRAYSDFEKFFLDLEADTLLGIDDKKADLWRYPVKKDGTEHLPVHFGFDVQEFSRRMDVVLAFLEGASIGLGVKLDATYEMLAEQASYAAECYEPDPSDGCE